MSNRAAGRAGTQKLEVGRTMTGERTDLGRQIETALGEVLAHIRGETALPCRMVDDPAAARIDVPRTTRRP